MSTEIHVTLYAPSQSAETGVSKVERNLRPRLNRPKKDAALQMILNQLTRESTHNKYAENPPRPTTTPYVPIKVRNEKYAKTYVYFSDTQISLTKEENATQQYGILLNAAK